MMRTQMTHDMERLMKKCNGNEDVRKRCESNDEFRDAYRASIKEARELLEYILQKRGLKKNTFKILSPADENDINCYVNTELEKIDPNHPNLKDLKSHEGISKHALMKNFFETPVRRRSYFFQIRKCTDLNCKFDEKLRGADEITEFPDPEPYEVDGVQHYKAGNDPTEKYLPSKLEDPEKKPHNIPFPPGAQTAKNMRLTIKCVECEKPRLLHSKHKLMEQQVKTLKSFLSKIICMWLYLVRIRGSRRTRRTENSGNGINP